jgi:hypothetical protein
MAEVEEDVGLVRRACVARVVVACLGNPTLGFSFPDSQKTRIMRSLVGWTRTRMRGVLVGLGCCCSSPAFKLGSAREAQKALRATALNATG